MSDPAAPQPSAGARAAPDRPERRGSFYQLADRLLFRPLGPELAHKLALLALALGLSPRGPRVDDPYAWRGLRFPNRVGVAAGFDKNAFALAGLAGIGAGFAEIGTILTTPWPGSPLRPRMARLEATRGVWNRLGFPSIGVQRVARRLAASRCGDMLLGCNIAPHPLTIRRAGEPGFEARVRAELGELVRELHPWASFFVVNLSSPNTTGLRNVLHGEGFAEQVIAPIREQLQAAAREAGRQNPTPLLVKLPPETAEREPWRPDSLQKLIGPLASSDVCDGFVAVNTSSGLALASSPFAQPDAPGGVSGAPLFPHALEAMRALAQLAHPAQLRIGVGGVSSPADALAMVEAGAHLVEIYSGMVYQGPRLLGRCAQQLRDDRQALGGAE